MTSETVSSKQAISLAALFLAGNAMITGNAGWVGQDSWISLLLAGVLVLPLVLICARISSLLPGCGFFDALFQVFGRPVGWVLCLLTTLYVFQIGVVAIRSFTEFVHVVSLGQTPQLFVAVCVALPAAYAVSKGLDVVGRGAVVLMAIVAATIAFTVLMLIPSMDLQNLLPLMSHTPEEIASGSAAWFAFPLAEGVALLTITGGVREGQSRYRVCITALCIGVALLLTALLRNLLVFGGEIAGMMQFPSYVSARMIEIGGFVQRIEAIISGNMLVCVFARLCVSIYGTSRGLARLAGVRDYGRICFPVALLAAALSPFLFSNAAEMSGWVRATMRVTVPFQIALPVLVWIGAEIHAGRRRRRQARGAPAGERAG